MSLTGILIAAAVVAGTGLLIGLLLGVASEKFKVEVDEKELLIRDALPGNNCGGCGYAGCDGLAKAIALGEAAVNACPVGGSMVSDRIGEIMGVASTDCEKEVAFVKCAGTCEKTTVKYEYYGLNDCKAAMVTPGTGPKACEYGCLGMGSCVRACPFDAIHIINGVATVEKDKCVACGKCVVTCPKQLIELVPYSATYLVQCNSKDKGKTVKQKCQVGCIGCGMCQRVCEYNAINIKDHLATIDQTACNQCGKCAEKCPTKIIQTLHV